jgi:hypothetical protein
MAAAIPLVVSTLVSTGGALYAQKSAENAANAQSEHNQNLLKRKKETQRAALAENSTRQQANKRRYLAKIRAQQAASGFNIDSGTPLAVFGEIESRLDEDINESTSRALDAIGNTDNQMKGLQFGDEQREIAGNVNRVGIGVKSVSDFSTGYSDNYQRYGSDPFGILKKQNA